MEREAQEELVLAAEEEYMNSQERLEELERQTLAHTLAALRKPPVPATASKEAAA